MLRYKKEDIINQQLDLIIPSIYKEHHRELILNFIKNSYDDISPYFSKDQDCFVKSKTGYIIPIFSNVNPYLSDNLVSQSLLFFNILKFKKKFRNKIYLLTNTRGIIKELTSNTSLYLQISKEKIQTRRLNINNFIEKALVLNNYRTEGIVKKLKNFENQSNKYRCFIKSILIKNFEAEKMITDPLLKRQLMGFVVILELI